MELSHQQIGIVSAGPVTCKAQIIKLEKVLRNMVEALQKL